MPSSFLIPKIQCLVIIMRPQITAWIVQAKLSTTEKIVLFALGAHTDKNNTCYPSTQTLAQITALSKRSVIRAIKSLAEQKYIALIQRCTPTGKRTSNCYRLNCPVLPKNSSDTVSPMAPVTSDTVSPDNHGSSDTVSPTPCHSVTIHRDIYINNYIYNLTYSFELLTGSFSDAPKKLKPPRVKNPSTALTPERKKSLEKIFDEIWAIYPRQENKEKARRLFRQLKLDTETIEQIKNYIRAATPAWVYKQQHGEAKYVPTLRTVLYEKRWTEPPPTIEEPIHRAPRPETSAYAAELLLQDFLPLGSAERDITPDLRAEMSADTGLLLEHYTERNDNE